MVINKIAKPIGFPINTLPDEFFTKKFIGMLLMVIATGVGFMGGAFPDSPPILEKWVKKNPWLKWAMVYILILQGAAGFNESLALVGTGIMFLIHKKLMDMSVEEQKEYIKTIDKDNIDTPNEDLLSMLKQNINELFE